MSFPIYCSQLLKIVATCADVDDGVAVGSLTAADRSTWYKVEHILLLCKFCTYEKTV